MYALSRRTEGIKMENQMSVQEALRAVVRESKQPYAITYAQAGLELGGSQNVCLVETDGLPGVVSVLHEKTGKVMVGQELKVQLLYVLSNLSGWRGERAREVKAVLKAASK
jgi:hypothetical protein